MELWQYFLASASVSAVVSYLLSRWVIMNGKSWRIMDDPATHKHPKVTHKQAVPRGGGIPIIGAVLVGSILFMPKDLRTVGIILGTLILAWAGWIDDRNEEKFSPYIRLFINIAAALFVIGAGIGIAYITSPLGGVINLDQPQWCLAWGGSRHCVWILSDIFALVWLVWMQNIVGWSSGVDGQLPGFVIIAAAVMAALGLRFAGDVSQFRLIVLAGITAGAFGGFLPWNWYPQKMTPGYGGKSLAGFLLGTLAILSSAKVGAMLLVLGLPTIDALLVIAKRLREGRSPVWGGREHVHHYLLDKGWSKRKIAIFYWILSAIFGLFAWRLNPTLKLYTMAIILLIIGGSILWLQNWSTYSKQQDQDSG